MSGQIKAAKRFKSLIETRRPDIVHSILGQASRLVKPPLSIFRSGTAPAEAQPRRQSITSTDVNEARQALIEEGDETSADLAGRLDSLPEKLKSAIVAAEAESSELPDSPNVLRKVQTEPIDGERPRPGKGHAHDVLDDQLYLNIGPGPANNDGAHDGIASVCESPTNVNYNVYEQAYEQKVEEIQQNRGKRATVYLTRRVEQKWNNFATTAKDVGSAPALYDTTKSGFASLVGKAVDGPRDHKQGQ